MYQANNPQEKPIYICKYEVHDSDTTIKQILEQAKVTGQKSDKYPKAFTPCLIGSRAFREYYPKYRNSEFSVSSWTKKDYDLITDIDGAIALIPPQSERYSNGNYGSGYGSYNYWNSYNSYTPNYNGTYFGSKLTVLHVLIDGKEECRYKLHIQVKDGNYDIEIATSTDQSAHWIASQTANKTIQMTTRNVTINVANPSSLEAIKTSHIYYSHNFSKHIEDLHTLRRYLTKTNGDSNKVLSTDDDNYILNQYMESVIPNRSGELNNVILNRRKEIERIKGVPGEKVNLNMSNDAFLETEGNLLVPKMIKHDDIHELVKFNEHPLYMKLKEDHELAKCLKSLWDKLTKEEQLQDIMEEGMVLALERYILPEYIKDEQKAYTYAIIRICTTITKGWFRKAAVDNWPLIRKCPKPLWNIAAKIISKYEKDNWQVEPLDVDNIKIPNYFTENELPIAKVIMSRIEEIGDSDDESGNDYNNDYDSDNYDDNGNYIEKPESDSKSVKKWINKGHDNYLKEDLSGYGGGYSHNNSAYSLPTTRRIFRIHETEFNPEIWTSIETSHEFSVGDCSESITWGGKIILSSPSDTIKTSIEKLNSYSYYDSDPPKHYLQLTVGAGCYGGGSDYNSESENVHGSKKVLPGINHSLILRTVLALINPHMVPAGENQLGKHLAENKIPSAYESVDEQSDSVLSQIINTFTGKQLPETQHPWFNMFIMNHN
jgi:uncharacterized protein YozE (UPF0346 family)